jgi:hypothetical protein
MWMRMLCIAAKASPIGYVTVNGQPLDLPVLARLCGCLEGEATVLIGELDRNGVFSRDRKGRIYNRRLVKDAQRMAVARENGKDGGNPEIRRGTVPKADRSRPFRRSDSPEKTKRIFRKNGGRCHWCSVELVFDSDALVPNLFHVDHLIPVCDGGRNDEDNLVPACAWCNHARARKSWVNPSDTNPVNNTDTKTQSPESRSPDSPSVSKSSDFETCAKTARTRRQYPPDFEAFWSGYPTDRNMSKSEAFDAWRRLSQEDRQLAQLSLPAFRSYCQQHPDYRPIHANRYLAKRRYEGHLEAASKFGGQARIKPRSNEWVAWRAYKVKAGHPTEWMDSVGASGQEFPVPSQWPPDHQGEAAA